MTFYDPPFSQQSTFSEPGFGGMQNALEPYAAPHIATNPFQSAAGPIGYHDPSAGMYGTTFSEPGYGVLQNALHPYTNPAAGAEYGPYQTVIQSPVPRTLGEQVANIPHYEGPISGGLLDSGALDATASAGRFGSLEGASLKNFIGKGTGGRWGSAWGNVLGDLPGGGWTGIGAPLAAQIGGQELVGHTRVGTLPHTIGHGIAGAGAGAGLGVGALVAANVLAPEIALPTEAIVGAGAAIGGALGLFGHKGKGGSSPQTGFGTDTKKNDTLINQIMEQQMQRGTLSLGQASNLRDSYNLQLQIAGSDDTQKLAIQKQMLSEVVGQVTQHQQTQQTQANQLQQQSQLSHMLQPYLRSNIAQSQAMAQSEAAIRDQLPPAIRAIADLEAHQALVQGHQTAASLAGAAAVGPGLNQLIQAINAQNAIQNRTNALATTGASGSGSIIPQPGQ